MPILKYNFGTMEYYSVDVYALVGENCKEKQATN